MIFLDTGDVQQIKKFCNTGIIRGITTNPTILKNDGVKDVSVFLKELSTICRLPVSVELESTELYEMELELDGWKNSKFNTIFPLSVKIPIHGPDGTSYLPLIRKAAGYLSINATAMMSAQQLYLAALAGAEYVSLFGGRTANMGYSVEREIEKYIILRDNMFGSARLIVGSVREVVNVIDWLVAGADIVTVPPEILDKMIVNPYTKETVQMFAEDANETRGNSSDI